MGQRHTRGGGYQDPKNKSTSTIGGLSFSLQPQPESSSFLRSNKASSRTTANKIKKGLKMYENGDIPGALIIWKKALDRTDNSLDRFGILSYMAMATHDLGALPQLLEVARLQLAAARKTGPNLGESRADLLAEACLNMARAHGYLSQFDRSVFYCGNCLDHASGIAPPPNARHLPSESTDHVLPRSQTASQLLAVKETASRLDGYAHYTLGQNAFWTGQITHSLQCYDKALITAKTLSDEVLELVVFLGLGQTFFILRDYHKASLYFTRAEKMSQGLKKPEFLKFSRQVSLHMASSQMKLGNNETSSRLVDSASHAASVSQDREILPHCALVKADLHIQSGQPLWGYWEAEAAMCQFDIIQSRVGRVLALMTMARAAERLASVGSVCQCKPLELYQSAHDLSAEINTPILKLRCCEKLQHVYKQLNDKPLNHEVTKERKKLEDRLFLHCTSCKDPIGSERDSLEIVACAHILHERCARRLKAEQLSRTLGSLRPVYCPLCAGSPHNDEATTTKLNVNPSDKPPATPSFTTKTVQVTVEASNFEAQTPTCSSSHQPPPLPPCASIKTTSFMNTTTRKSINSTNSSVSSNDTIPQPTKHHKHHHTTHSDQHRRQQHTYSNQPPGNQPTTSSPHRKHCRSHSKEVVDD